MYQITEGALETQSRNYMLVKVAFELFRGVSEKGLLEGGGSLAQARIDDTAIQHVETCPSAWPWLVHCPWAYVTHMR